MTKDRASRDLRHRLDRLGRGARNAFDLIAEGRLSGPYTAPYEVVAQGEIHRLRRYTAPPSAEGELTGPVLLIPPLMVYSEVYDISPELSAVSWLSAQGVDVWLIDFGAPEKQEGGMKRTLDDHVIAIDQAIDRIREERNLPVHIAGYSQGGMFCYETAAYRRCRDIASIITFGSPVDIYRNLPLKVHDGLAGRLLKAAGEVVKGPLKGPLEELRGISGTLSSATFKFLYPGNEVKHLGKLLGVLPDRKALEAEVPKRRFLRGEGFVAWPGPAFVDFVEQVVLENRLSSGGLVVNGRSVSLADITCPVLYFYGTRDNLARPSAVKGIGRVAPRAEARGVEIDSGHFGLVVGTRALARTWPIVVEWLRCNEAEEKLPDNFGAPLSGEDSAAETSPDLGPQMYRLATDLVDGLWQQLGEASLLAAGVIDSIRWQLPRLARLESLHDRSRVSMGRALAGQAAAIPDETFFLWKGRTYTYAEADWRVSQMAAALHASGVEAEDNVGVLMENHPDYLVVVAAISRLGAVSVLVSAEARGEALEHALQSGTVSHLVTDLPEHDEGCAHLSCERLLFVGASRRDRGPLPEGAVDLDELLETGPRDLPSDLAIDQGRAGDLAMMLTVKGPHTGEPRIVRVTNRRWANAALGAAAGCRLTPNDTVYCCLPLHTGMGMLVTVGSSLVGGTRLALSPRFTPESFWEEARRTGSTVVPYTGELCRALADAPPLSGEAEHPVRLFVGRGLQVDDWRRILDRFGPLEVLEFYASLEGNLVLANLTGEKIGSVGRQIVETTKLELVQCERETGKPLRGSDSRLLRARRGQPGLLISRIDGSHPLAAFDGYTDPEATESRIIRDAFVSGDAWFDTGDLFERDDDGDYWLLESDAR